MSGDMEVFPIIFQTREEQEAQQTLCRENQNTSEPLPTWRDRAGNIKTMYGNPLYDENPELVSPARLAEDFTSHGFRLVVVECLQREGDDEFQRLRMAWSKNEAVGITLDAKQKQVARKYADLFYWKHHGIFNAKAVSLQGQHNPIQGSIANLIFSGVMKSWQVENNHKIISEVRLTEENGQFEFVPFVPGVTNIAQSPSQRYKEYPVIPLATLADVYDRSTSHKR
ncbi:MAG: hypothetical protein Q7K35_00390 [bacterium]|nr:hypothetical protein [bacterium]